jgi:hypothetical protein
MADNNTDYTNYVRKSRHRVPPGNRYYGEAVLRDPRSDVPTNFQAPWMLSLIMKGRTETEEQVVAEYVATENREKEALFQMWKEQDAEFAKKEAEDAAASELEREEAEEKEEAENQARIDAWGNNEKWAALPKMKMSAPPLSTNIAVPAVIRTKALMSKEVDLGHFHPDRMEAYAARTTGKTERDTTLVQDPITGVYQIRKQDKIDDVTDILDMSFSDVIRCGKWYTKALGEWGGPDDLREAWEAFFFFVDNHNLTGSESGREILKHLVKIQWQSYHRAMEKGDCRMPSKMRDTLESEARTAWITANEVKREKAVSLSPPFILMTICSQISFSFTLPSPLPLH